MEKFSAILLSAIFVCSLCSWHPDWGVGKYSRYGKIIYLDLIADDWEVVDVVAEVNKQQEQILKDRNEH